MKNIFLSLLLLFPVACATLPAPQVAPATAPLPIPAPVPSVAPQMPRVGITLDDTSNLPAIIETLKALPAKIAVRVVFDENVAASEYKHVTEALSPYAFIVGELLDSFYVKSCNQACYEARAKEYIAALPLVDVWEIGNESNGVGWLGAGVMPKIIAAYTIAHAHGKLTMLTLYMDGELTWKPWAASLPLDMRTSLNYVMFSDYPHDNDGYQANWRTTFDEAGALFPTAKLGVGEMGLDPSKFNEAKRRAEFNRYYVTLFPTITHPRFIGFGGFWYQRDVVGKNAPLFNALKAVLK